MIAVSRRSLLAGFLTAPLVPGIAGAQVSDSLVIDLAGPPESIDPALAYSPKDWSIVHSMYDSIVQFNNSGEIELLAADSFETADAQTFSVRLRSGMTFHDGSPVTADAVARGIAHVQASESEAASLFGTIERVDVLDELNANIVCSSPSPWLPAQLAVWCVLVPEGFTTESALASPVGSGPYRFVSQEAGSELKLARNADYLPDSAKGVAVAEEVVFRFVPEPTTRVADLSTGAAQLVTELPTDTRSAVESSGATFISDPVVGIGFVRIASDVAPFDDVRVRRALNHAIDAETIATSLLGEEFHRISSALPDERSNGFDPSLESLAYDPELARSLLLEAGLGDGFSTTMEMTTASRVDVAEAVVAQLAEVGIQVELVTSDYATFNATWADESAPPLRMVTWTPLFEPHTFFSLIFSSSGWLSRYSNTTFDEVFAASSIEPNPEERTALLMQANRVLHDDPAAVYLWNLVASYGVQADLPWQPRGDEYVLPMRDE